MEVNQDMPVIIQHPDIRATSILKRRIKGRELINISTKSVNFSQHTETKHNVRQNEYHDNIRNEQTKHELNTTKEDDCAFQYDKSIETPEQQKIISRRRNRSQSLPAKKKVFILRNRNNAKDANVELATFEFR